MLRLKCITMRCLIQKPQQQQHPERPKGFGCCLSEHASSAGVTDVLFDLKIASNTHMQMFVCSSSRSGMHMVLVSTCEYVTTQGMACAFVNERSYLILVQREWA